MSADHIESIKRQIKHVRQRGGTFTTSLTFMEIAWCNHEIKQQVKQYFQNLGYIIHDPPTSDTRLKAYADERNDLLMIKLAMSSRPTDRLVLFEFPNEESLEDKKNRLNSELIQLSSMMMQVSNEIQLLETNVMEN